MNIFVTNRNPTIAALDLDDKRVKHMPKECMELMAMYVYSLNKEKVIPIPFWNKHKRNFHDLYNHPVSQWVRRDKKHLAWLAKYTNTLVIENLYRFNEFIFHDEYNRLSKSIFPLIRSVVLSNDEINFRNSSLFKDINDPVEAYRKTMKVKWFETDKVRPVIWTKRGPPKWLEEQLTLNI